ncbi:unnamed protein product [Rotaria sordida]|uniref:Uncharacterized protein n=1 Tax=Rotaria sordida TaxID=392033 RepID=A0A818MZK8_9BILA|nr:unnamed protein product [Rotaria sordida]CAF1134936.1 unnamed protein product [Rotaria sordida]CAF3596350.1 unnamed protein product [Rotaria sordida]CAF3623866.1 unnamed protein product [Rotaria sordida]
MPHKKLPSDVEHKIGYAENEQHIGKPKVTENKEVAGPQAGLDGEKGSKICGQGGPEILGGSASTRVLGQSVDEQLKTSLPPSSEQ